jgi:transcriptional regulator GlxA family with amidase domain
LCGINPQYRGRQAMLDRLFEVVLIQVLRQLMERGNARAGVLAGLAHQRLRLALIAMHEQPEQPEQEWSLESLADTAGMSRSVFANTFRDTVGTTPGACLQRCRAPSRRRPVSHRVSGARPRSLRRR